MPICVDRNIQSIPEEEFKKIVYKVTGQAFDIYDEYGRFFHENVLKHKIAHQCQKSGLQSEVELSIQVRFRNFQKEYFVDLLINQGCVFEIKRVSSLNDNHRAQTLNYLFLLNLQRVKLINFGQQKVEHEFISTTLSEEDRREFSVDTSNFFYE